MNSSKWLSLLSECAEIADDVSRYYYRSSSYHIKTKSDNTPVTDADQNIEQKIRQYVQRIDSNIVVLGEEYSPTAQAAAVRLIVDPIDGTENFIRGIPLFATLLAIEVNGEVCAGVVSAPIMQDRWSAEKGLGCIYNKNPITVSSINDLSEAQAFHGSLYGAEAKNTPVQFWELLRLTKRQRGFGDYYPAMLVAMGCGEFGADFGIKPWDVAPLKIIVEEAGGKVTDLEGKFSLTAKNYIYSNGQLHEQILSVLKKQ